MLFKKLGKMENVVLRSVRVDLNLSFHTYRGWECRGTAHYSIGLKHYKVDFIYLDKTEYKVAYFEDLHYSNRRIPKNRLQNEALLVLIRGEIEKFKGRQEQIQFFRQRRKQEEEEQRQKEEEERKKRIALGEQVTIEKYLLNKEV